MNNLSKVAEYKINSNKLEAVVRFVVAQNDHGCKELSKCVLFPEFASLQGVPRDSPLIDFIEKPTQCLQSLSLPLNIAKG